MVLSIFFLSLLPNWRLLGMGRRRVGFRFLPPRRMVSGPIQHFYSAILDASRYVIFAKLSERKGFFGAEYVDFKGFLQQLTSSHLRERDKNVVKSHSVRESLERIPSWQGQEGTCSLQILW